MMKMGNCFIVLNKCCSDKCKGEVPMKNLQTSISKHKKLFCVLGFVFIVCLECCVFPVGRVPLGGDRISVFINIYAAIVISKCVSGIEVVIFPKATWLMILLLNFGITVMGMTARYLLEYGEVSNTYNFTPKNIVVHIVIMLLLSMMFWLQARRKVK